MLLATATAACAAETVVLHAGAPDQTRVGALVRRGGLSSIEISADGSTLLAITDRGDWFRLWIGYDKLGDLVAAEIAEFGQLPDASGELLEGDSRRDAEALARLEDGTLVVAFERDHRLLAYPPGSPPVDGAPVALEPPIGLGTAPDNKGIEALTELGGGRMLAIAEEMPAISGFGLAWLGDGKAWTPMSYALARTFKPTGAARLPNGDLVVVERRFSIAAGLASRIVHVPRRTLRPGAPIAGRKLARLEPPFLASNFEGITARTGPRGETLIYLASDDNFSALQRTLVVMFELVN